MLQHNISTSATLPEAEIKPVKMNLELVSIFTHDTNEHMQSFVFWTTDKMVSHKESNKNTTANSDNQKTLGDIYQNFYLHQILQDKTPTTKPSASKCDTFTFISPMDL